MDERRPSIGDLVKITKTTFSGNRNKHISIRKGKVTAIYRYFFCVRIGSHVECFRWNEFFGNEEVKVTLL